MSERSRPQVQPRHAGYFADPFVLRAGNAYYAYGTGPRQAGERVFEVLRSEDLQEWTSLGGALEPLPGAAQDYWAPEVAAEGGRFYMYYSVGQGDQHHQLRVAVAEHPQGPFQDSGVVLTPDEPFAIDPSPFRDEDGQWYLYFARDVLEGERVGTSLAVMPLSDMLTPGGPITTVLRASADWQLYARQRPMYGRTLDWHTLEGPFVVRRNGLYHCFYSGGAWTNDTYGVGHAVAEHPLGPWREPQAGPVVLRSGVADLIGPGHNSLITDEAGQDWIVFHAWNAERTERQLHLLALDWSAGGPRPVL
ncbi:glycoside hydrolase [Deinococcus irradiatisoli]|uniref:Glycoside hydrolase n=1 Tax=Deinococcus irradiatisoli TaxID=2202254 RepID=A0A2Z3JHK0_9DEIO|nr:glycoside hydrolase [Deinococcus irradiatisoli]